MSHRAEPRHAADGLRPRLIPAGLLDAGSRRPQLWAPLKDQLRELGYVEGQNIAFESRWAHDKVERLPDLAAELVALRVDKERVELAMALWESLTDAEREAELALTPEPEAELDRRLAEHIADPWDEVRRKLAGGA